MQEAEFPGGIYRNVIALGKQFTAVFENGIIDNIFRVISMEAKLEELSIDSTIVRAHQSIGRCKKRGSQSKIGRSRGGLSTKIHAVVDALGYPLHILLSEGQEHDSAYAVEVLSNVKHKGKQCFGR